MTRQKSTEAGKAEFRREIDANLKRAFDSFANEPVPDRLTDLLEKLRTSEQKAPNGSPCDD